MVDTFKLADNIMELIISIVDSLDLFRNSKGRPRKYLDKLDSIINAIWYLLHTGCQWRSIPILYFDNIPWKSIYNYFIVLVDSGVLYYAWVNMVNIAYMSGLLEYVVQYTDATYNKNYYGIDYIGSNPTDRGRSSTKVSVTVTKNGIPIGYVSTHGNKADSKILIDTIDSIPVLLPSKSRKTPQYMKCDKGYSNSICRKELTSRGYIPMIPYKSNSKTQITPYEYTKSNDTSGRDTVERFFSKIDKYRRVLVRYEKSIYTFDSLNYLAMCLVINNIICV